MGQHTHMDWGSGTQTMLLFPFIFIFPEKEKSNPTKFLGWSCGQCCPWGFRHCIWNEMSVKTFLEGGRILICH